MACNWYTKSRRLVSKASGFTKSASTTSSEEKEFFDIGSERDNISDHSQAINQVGEYMTVFDLARYVFDSYNIKIAISSSNKRFAVSVAATHGFLGTMTWSQYWFYDKKDFKKAKDTYEKVREKTIEIMELFVKEEMPTPMFWAFLRKATQDIDHDATIRSNIPVINYAEQYREERSPDWRSNLYGTRYPKRINEESYDQYLSSKRERKGKFPD